MYSVRSTRLATHFIDSDLGRIERVADGSPLSSLPRRMIQRGRCVPKVFEEREEAEREREEANRRAEMY